MTAAPCTAGRGRIRAGASPVVLALALALPALVASAPAASASTTPPGQLSFFAGAGSAGPPTPGPAINSQLSYVYGLDADSAGNVYIADGDNHRVEKVTPSGSLSTIAGNGTAGLPTAGPALNSPLGFVEGVAVDPAGNVYIADYDNNMVEKVTPGGTLSVIAGTGTAGMATPGPGAASQLNEPYAVAVNGSGDVFVADYGNSVVDKVTAAGVLSIVAGTGTPGPVTAGPATSSDLAGPDGLAVDPAGNLYIGDYSNHVAVKVTTGGQLSTVLGNGDDGTPTPGPATATAVSGPAGLAVDRAGSLFMADYNNNQVYKVTSAGQVSIAAGTGSSGPATEGPAVDSDLSAVNDVAFAPNGDLLVADSENYRVERVTQAPISTGPIADKYASLGGPASFLGAPVGSEFTVPGGRAQNYARGVIIWSPATGAHEMHGAILQHWAELGADGSVLGLPTSDESAAAGGGRVNTFVGGLLLFSPATGAREVHGSIAVRYLSAGGPGGPLGYPQTDETVTPDGAGRYNLFSHGSVYWSRSTGARVVRGAILAKWAALGSERSLLGYPVTDELGTPGATGRYNHFVGGSVYWSPATGAHEVHGAIQSAWASMGWERSALGFPVSDEYAVPGGRRSDFTGGSLTYDFATGAVTMTH